MSLYETDFSFVRKNKKKSAGGKQILRNQYKDEIFAESSDLLSIFFFLYTNFTFGTLYAFLGNTRLFASRIKHLDSPIKRNKQHG